MNALTSALCPWLVPELQSLERAHAEGRLGHGWIVAGPEGTGKLNLAMVLAARLLNRQIGSAPPRAIAPGELIEAVNARRDPQDHHPDLHTAWPDDGKRTIGIETIRNTIEAVSLTGYSGDEKVVVIAPAEAMTVQAANALLKSLEEPAGGTRVLLVSHCVGRLPATIRSRCQLLTVRRPAPEALAEWLGRDAGTNPLVTGEQVGPVQAAARLQDDEISKYSKLDDLLSSLSRGKTDPGVALETCRGLDPGLILEWISNRARCEIRHRCGQFGSNSVTAAPADLTENRPALPATDKLFAILDESTRLNDQLGSGKNEQLALEVILSAFCPA